jgi:hypothetical protein
METGKRSFMMDTERIVICRQVNMTEISFRYWEDFE